MTITIKSFTYDLHRHHRPMDLVGFALVLGHSTRPDSSTRSVATRRILASNSDAWYWVASHSWRSVHSLRTLLRFPEQTLADFFSSSSSVAPFSSALSLILLGFCSWLFVTQRRQEKNHPETMPDAPRRIVNLAKIPTTLAEESVISSKNINP